MFIDSGDPLEQINLMIPALPFPGETRTDLNPWLLSTDDPLSLQHRDAFVGNGLLGQRISPWGDGSAYEGRSQSWRYGFWGRDKRDNEALMELPTWAVLDFHHPGPMGRRCERVLNHRQSLDLRTGTVETRYRVEGSHWAGEIRRRAWISRSEPNLSVLELEIVPEKGWYIELIERFDASWMSQTQAVHTAQGECLELHLEAGPDRRPLHLASRLETHGQVPERTTERLREGCVERFTWLKVEPGKPIKATRFVVIADDGLPEMAFDLTALRQAHEKSWAALWESRIEVPHAPVQQLVNACVYHLYSQTRAGVPLAIGPCGISGDGYCGRVFWDADLWVFPPLALLQPELAKGMVEYRYETLEGAKESAREDGYEGACFSWESAATGKEWVPFPKIHQQRHVNSDVAWAQWFYVCLTGDTHYLREKAFPVILESARYWASRAVHNAEADRYELLGIYCPDEYAAIRDNNACTNYGAAWTLRKAAELAERFGVEAPVDRFREIADKMYIPWDEEHGVIAEFEGWTDERVIKQADTTLLIYPWEMPMETELKARIVDYYRAHYPKNKIMMGSAIDGIIDCELGRPEHAWESFIDLLPHFHPPYFTASESPTNDCMNFLTGIGGLLQLVLMGFGGIRVRETGIEIPPPSVSTKPLPVTLHTKVSQDFSNAPT
ncbi:MAG: glycoside hydrolase family 65 protein [Opitutales bacterium]|nr:glycoside hydrolase family 65 protein [Opitutales bacterium]